MDRAKKYPTTCMTKRGGAEERERERERKRERERGTEREKLFPVCPHIHFVLTKVLLFLTFCLILVEEELSY